MSQLDLALAADMSQRHISFLESGRTNPSRLTIERLCHALEMPASERERLYLAAGFALFPSDTRWDAEVRRAVDASLRYIIERHEPYPAMIVDRLWNLVSANQAAARFLGRLGGAPERNVIRALLDPACLRSRLLNWRDAAARLLSLIEQEIARRLNDPEGEQVLQSLLALPGVRDIAPRIQESIGPALVLHFQVDTVELRLFSLVATIGLTADSGLEDLKLETLLPADEATKEWFTR